MPDRPWPKLLRLGSELYSDPANVFHLVIRAFPGTAPFTDIVAATTWTLLMNERNRSSIRLFASCLMPDHLHLLASPEQKSIPSWVNGFKGHVVRTIRDEAGTSSIWQPRYYDRLLRSEEEMRDVISYIASNPVTAGHCTEPDDWPWTYISPDS